MIDFKKRKALKFLGGATAVAMVPTISRANGLNEAQLHSHAAVQPALTMANTRSDLSVAVSSGNTSFITLTNNSTKAITVKHVHPGIVHAGEKTFNINAVFENGAQRIEPGTSAKFAAGTIKSTQAESSFPRHLYRKLPQRAVSVTGADNRGQFVNSTRSFYA